MSLAAKVIARYNDARLKQLTTQGDPAAAAVDATILGLACTDVQADFEIYAGVVYDDSAPRHASVAVEGVVAKLAIRAEAAGGGSTDRHDRYIERLKDLAKVTGRDRIIPTSKSQLTPTAEKDGTETVRPDFDRPNFDDLIPAAPD